MPEPDPIVRTLQADDADAMVNVLLGAFLADVTPAVRARELLVFEPGRFHGAFESQTMIGCTGILTRTLTVPDQVSVPVAAVTAVGVAPDRRRRGVLTTLMRTQLQELHESGGEAIAALWASEGGIYGRFGYGLAGRRLRLTVSRPVTFRGSTPDAGQPVQLVDADAAKAAMRKLHTEYVTARVGGLSRPEQSWAFWLFDDENDRNGASAYRHAVHPAGYAVFRIKENWQSRGPRHEIALHELVSVTPDGHAALWRFLLGLDLVGEVLYRIAPLDEPLPLMLTDHRTVQAELADALFVRLVDVGRALAARRYLAPVDVVFEVADAFCPWNAGRWRLSVDESGWAQVERTAAAADLACGAIDLGAAYLGSTRLHVLAAAGRVRELRAGALLAASAAFATQQEPHCLEVF